MRETISRGQKRQRIRRLMLLATFLLFPIIIFPTVNQCRDEGVLI